MTDPFEHFGEQQQSHEFLQDHSRRLIQEARRVLREFPDADPVGVVLSADAPEAAELMEAFRAQSDSADFPEGAPPPGGIITLMPREHILEILRANHPSVLDWLTDGKHTGPDRRLPLVAITKQGARLAEVGYAAEDGDDSDDETFR